MATTMAAALVAQTATGGVGLPPGPYTPEELAQRKTVECFSGWSFVLLVMGVLCFSPAAIIAGIATQNV